MTNSDLPIIKPCIVCKKELQAVWPLSDEDNTSWIAPYSGISFSGAGGYGSSLDMSPELVINICDDCVQDAIRKDEVLIRETVTPRITHTYKTAKLDEDGYL